MSYQPPIQDLQFLLQAFGYEEKIQSLEPFADFDLETCMDLIETYSAFCTEVLEPLNAKGDREGVTFDPTDHSVTLPDGFKEAYQQYCENGFGAIALPPEHGGLGGPFTLATIVQEVIAATNKSFSMCPGLSSGLIEALEAHGSEEICARFMPPLVSGEWTGTMCLTEPQCGTDLGLLTTRAEPFGDHYKVTGTKVWITFGEHNLTDNIVHLVLARLPGAPEGIRESALSWFPSCLRTAQETPCSAAVQTTKWALTPPPPASLIWKTPKAGWLGNPTKECAPCSP